MTQQNPFADFFKQWESALKDASGNVPSVDFNAAFEAGQKNLEAFAATQKAVAESVQEVANLQSEAAQKSVESALQLFNEVAASKDPRESATKQAEYAKNALTAAANNAKEVAELASKSQQKIADMVNSQLADNMAQFNDVAKQTATTAAKSSKKAA